jgi:hypothetical protein
MQPLDAEAVAAKGQAAKEQAAKEQAAKEQAAKEQAAKGQAAKEQAAKEQAKEQAAVQSIVDSNDRDAIPPDFLATRGPRALERDQCPNVQAACRKDSF